MQMDNVYLNMKVKNKKMKTTKLYTLIMIILAVLFAASLSATPSTKMHSGNNPEITINNDVPDFELIPEFNFEEEAYIEDIPFDTKCVSINCIYQKAIAEIFEFEEEAYVDDIPFATDSIALSCEFEFEDESYIDDIPFNTNKIAKHNNRNHFVYKR